MFRIGIDVGGTNTDAVVLSDAQDVLAENAIVAWEKSPTTANVTEGIAKALGAVIEKSEISIKDIAYVSIGTTHFVNAVIEANPTKLAKVAVIRLAGPYTKRCPPFIDFPPSLRDTIEGHVAVIDGGLQIDGKEIVPIKDEHVFEQCRIIKEKGLSHVVLVGVFSPLAGPGEQEEYVRDLIEKYFEGSKMEVVCSKDVGHVGLLERENAAILNAAILSFARETIRSYAAVLKKLSLSCPLYLTQLDGTLVNSRAAASVPIRTFSNGPTNSMRGASYLAKLDGRTRGKSIIVVDVGGTTTDVGVLLPSGFPRKAAAFTEVGGVRTSFSMPDIYSIGLGGGSYVFFDANGSATVGPSSVGLEIITSAKVFGGQVLTATDLAVVAGLKDTESIGDKSLVLNNITSKEVTAGMDAIRRSLETAIDRMKTDSGDAIVLLVGGGSVIVPPTLEGVQEIVRPPYFNVANAVGAAIARVSGTVDRIEIPGNRSFDEIIEACKAEAIQNAVNAGANCENTSIAEVAVIQLPYVANHASRVIVKAVGDLDLGALKVDPSEEQNSDLESATITDVQAKNMVKPVAAPTQSKTNAVDINTYTPSVSSDGIWTLSETDIEWIAEGCAILGCGGGGATYSAFLMARQAIRAGHKIRVVDIEYLLQNSRDAWILPCGFMGSPSVSSERIPSGVEIPTAGRNLVKFLGIEKISALISDEIGGKNGLEPMLLATETDFNLPIVDADLMGRAYPRLDQILPCIAKEKGLFPVVAADGIGNCMVVPTAENNAIVEDILRAACTVLGSSVGLSISPLQAHELVEHSIPGSTSQAWRIGRAVALCRRESTLSSVSEAITRLQDGKLLFVGKVCLHEVRGGFTHGRITVAPLLQEEMEGSNKADDQQPNAISGRMIIPFQNENLQAEIEHEDGSRKVVCCVPDLITVIDAQNGSAIGTQDYRYGLRVIVIGLACDPRWASPAGLKLGGPVAFGLDTKYEPIGVYKQPKSVVAEFRAS
ncbi:DUF917-domain-containing protein [Schizopora paradoxa]|uniref:DUF917-domain-containing protein n=1 Tax=Schizopora paradoxa TaxID=27342 RepID=A0A0H2RPJ3_9AGAM|nr:DUF917-domain-containing protein [Schizopora paradoxa]